MSCSSSTTNNRAICFGEGFAAISRFTLREARYIKWFVKDGTQLCKHNLFDNYHDIANTIIWNLILLIISTSWISLRINHSSSLTTLLWQLQPCSWREHTPHFEPYRYPPIGFASSASYSLGSVARRVLYVMLLWLFNWSFWHVFWVAYRKGNMSTKSCRFYKFGRQKCRRVEGQRQWCWFCPTIVKIELKLIP